MQTSLETIGQLERRLNMAVPLAEIESEVGKRLARLAKNVKVAGFRPGKVPMKMVVAQYGGQVRSDVISDALQSTFTDAIRAQNLRVAGNPRIEPRPGRLGARPARVLGGVRGVSGDSHRRPLRRHDRAPGRRGRARRTSTRRSTCCASSAHATSTSTAPPRRATA